MQIGPETCFTCLQPRTQAAKLSQVFNTVSRESHFMKPAPQFAAPSPLTTKERCLYGGLGALAPVITTALTLDLVVVFSNPDPPTVVAWSVRCILFFLVGGFVAFLHKTESDAWRCFVIGISAPALITTGFSGRAVNNTTPRFAEKLTFLDYAFARSTSPPISMAEQRGKEIELLPIGIFEETLSSKIRRGFFAMTRWSQPSL
jgi:hypothetical protein